MNQNEGPAILKKKSGRITHLLYGLIKSEHLLFEVTLTAVFVASWEKNQKL